MGQNDNRNKPQQSNNNSNLPLDQDMMRAWLDNQKLELQNQRAELDLRSKQQENNTKLSYRSLDIHEKVLTTQDIQFRKNITRIAWIVFMFFVVTLAFLGLCLVNDQKEFAYTFLKGTSYIVTSAISFWAGNKVKKKGKEESKSEDIQEF